MKCELAFSAVPSHRFVVVWLCASLRIWADKSAEPTEVLDFPFSVDGTNTQDARFPKRFVNLGVDIILVSYGIGELLDLMSFELPMCGVDFIATGIWISNGTCQKLQLLLIQHPSHSCVLDW